MLYVIKGLTFSGRLLYTKGKIARERDPWGNEHEILYIFISSKEATAS